MLVLLVISGLALLFSAAVHVFTLCGLLVPPGILVVGLNAGIGILLYFISILSKRLQQGVCKTDFTKAVREAPPKWMKMATGSIVLYGIIVFVIYLAKGYFGESGTSGAEVNVAEFYKGITALVMAFYAPEFSLLYSYWSLKNMGAR